MTGAETRSKATKNMVKKLDNQLQSCITTNDAKMKEMEKKIDLLVERLVLPKMEYLVGHPWDILQLKETGKAQGLCYRYGEKYTVGHQCKPKQISVMSTTVEFEEETLKTFNRDQPNAAENDGGFNMELQESEVMDKVISLHALSGTEVPNTLRLKGVAKK
ncbi:hypothetical protein T459_07193 [Capsicum annuum]|uniref:Uncharacterized protein n=1 Tax=Capsicum annuum TaxID=4072 RepID=A0A2G3AD11_CAPAN|nr:hypothetical protein FXO37_36065 [Capsicum annuum]PHT92080.1 hypothetical protein T459_07193 [Capsicum annuum]